jgi:nitroreductase
MTDQETLAPGEAVYQAILDRRSPRSFKPERPPRELIEKLLQAAIRAPNHYLNQPWRFFVITGEARNQLGDVFADRLAKTMNNPMTAPMQATISRERQKTLRAPVLLCIAVVQTPSQHALPIEDIEAGAAAVENLLLAAPALGLGAYWRTGEPAYSDEVKAFLGLKPEDHIVSFVYVGYPQEWGPVTPRTGYEDKTTWLGWDEQGTS